MRAYVVRRATHFGGFEVVADHKTNKEKPAGIAFTVPLDEDQILTHWKCTEPFMWTRISVDNLITMVVNPGAVDDKISSTPMRMVMRIFGTQTVGIRQQ